MYDDIKVGLEGSWGSQKNMRLISSFTAPWSSLEGNARTTLGDLYKIQCLLLIKAMALLFKRIHAEADSHALVLQQQHGLSHRQRVTSSARRDCGHGVTILLVGSR